MQRQESGNSWGDLLDRVQDQLEFVNGDFSEDDADVFYEDFECAVSALLSDGKLEGVPLVCGDDEAVDAVFWIL